MDTLQRIPGVDIPHSVRVRNLALKNIQMLVPPGAAFAELFLHCAILTKGRQGFFCLLNSIFVIRQRTFGDAQVIVYCLFLACSDGDMAVQCAARLTSVQVRIRKLTVFHFDGIPLVPVIAAEAIPVAAVRISLFAGAEVYQRGFRGTGMHPGCIRISDSLQLFVKNGAGIPFQVIAKGIFLFC